MSQESDLGWAAGIFDGEGTCHISRDRRSRWPRYSLTAAVANTERPMLVRMRRILGGSITAGYWTTGSTRPYYIWIVTGVTAQQVLMKIQPHLTTKVAQAQVAILFPRGRRGKPRHWSRLVSQAMCWVVLKRLNS